MKHTKIYHITARFLLAATLLAVSWTSATAAETVAAYAVLSDNNTVLTFYYDDQINSRGGMSVQDLGWLQMSSSVTSVQFDRTFASYSPESTSYWFSEMSQLQALDLSNLNMASVTNTDGMFMNSSRLTTIIVNDTWPAAESAMTPDGSSGVSGADMFNGCRSLVGGAGTTYDAQHIDYSYAHIDGGVDDPGYFTDAAGSAEAYAAFNSDYTVLTFYYDNQKAFRNGMDLGPFPNADYRGWNSYAGNITKVVFDSSMDSYTGLTSTASWFWEFTNLEEVVDIKYLHTDNVTSMDGMFGIWGGTGSTPYTGKLPAVDMTHFNTSKVVNMNGIFSNCAAITALDLSSFDTSSVTDMSAMFSGCTGLRTISVGSGWTTAKVTNSSMMFQDCTSLVGGAGTTYDASHTDVAYAHIDGGTSNPGYLTGNGTSVAEPYAVLDGTTLYFYYDNLKSSRGGMDINNRNIATDSSSPYGAATTAIIDASFANYRPTSTAWWFDKCSSLTAIRGIENLKTDNVTTMRYMFRGCSSLTSLDLSRFNTENVKTMDYMFIDCSGLTSLNLNNFNTDNVTTMAYMFTNCSGLTSLDVSSFNTVNVTSMSHMFTNCSGLTSLDLSNFNTANVTDVQMMFGGCSVLKTIYAGNEWSTSAVATYAGSLVFQNCTLLVGGAGTTFDASHIDYTYAHIDGGVDNPGYLTELIRKTLTADDYFEWNGMGAGATKKSETPSRLCNYYIGQSAEVPYGDPNVSAYAYADLSAYDRLEITATAGTPRILLNRDAEDGYWNADESQSHQIESTQSGWSSKYFSHSGNVWTVDLKQMVADKGFAHLNAIKGDNWSAVTITKMELVKINSTVTAGTGNPEPYAVLNDNGSVVTDGEGTTLSGKTLTFYYDDQKAVRGGMEVKPFQIGTYNGVWGVNSGWSEHCRAITTVEFDESFANCTTLTSTDYWFYSFSNLTTVRNIENLKTPNVTTMECMFGYCSSLTSLDLSSLNTDNVTSLYGMFLECTSLKTLDLSGFNTSKVTNMDFAFTGCSSLTSLDVTGFKTDNVEMMNNMFDGCSALTSIDLSHFNTEKVTNMSSMFYGCSSLTSLDVTGFNTSNVTHMGSMFRDCSGLTSLDLSHFDTKNVTNMNSMFSGCSGLTSLDLSNFNTESLTFIGYMFDGCSGLKSLDVSGFNTANVTSMECTFRECSWLTSLDLSGFNTSNVTNMNGMFTQCSSLTNLNVSNFNTEKVKDMGFMFSHCRSLTSLDLSGFNTSNVTDMITMFLGCSSLTSLDLSGFNTSNVTITRGMFYGCFGLTSLNMTGFNTQNVTDMGYMFYDCSSLTSLDLSNFNTSNVTSMENMFLDCTALKTIYAGNEWSTAAVTEGDEMFGGCTSLVGGAGTPYDASHVDYTYAHIDGGERNPGYFTDINPSIDPTFDEHGMLIVEGDMTMQQAVERLGGRQSVAQNITSLIWKSSATLSESDLDGFTNPNMLIFVDSKDKTTLTRNNVVIAGTAARVVLSDVTEGNGNFHCPQEFFADSIIYTHNYKQATEIGVSRGWETIALPFDVQTITHEKNGVIAPFGSSASDKHFWLRTLVDEQGLARATKIEANHAYLISMPNNGKYPAEYNLAGNVTFATAGVVVPETIYRASQLTTDNGRIILMPNFLRNDATPYYYVLNVGEARDGHPEGSVFEVNYREVLPFQAFTYHEGGQNPSRFISLDELMEGTTGIETIEQPQWSGAEQWWSIDGRKLNGKPSQKGVYIRNGKKVVVKATF